MNNPIFNNLSKTRIPPWERRLGPVHSRWNGRRREDASLADGRGAVLWYGLACGLLGLGILVLFHP